MDESTERAVRELLAKHGPASVLSTVAAVCAAEAKNRTDDEDVELWEVAADAATSAVTSLTTEDDEEEEAEGDEDDEDSEDESEEPLADDAAPDAAPVVAAAVAATTPDYETDEEETRAAHAPRKAQDRRTTMMATKDQRLGPRPAKATSWGCFRVDAGPWQRLDINERGDGILTNEWPVKTCTAELIAERWGDGDYVVQYIGADDAGKRRAVGRSRKLSVRGRNAPASHDEELEPPPPLPTPMPAAAAPVAPGPAIDPWSMITYLRDAEARARAEARAEAKEREARYRADVDLQIERERLASQERIAQMELQAKALARPSRGPDPEVASQLTELHAMVKELKEQRDEEEDDDEYMVVPAAEVQGAGTPQPPQAPSTPPLPDVLQQLLNMVGPALPALAQSLLDKAISGGRPPLTIPADIPFPSSKDPSKKPN